MTLRFAAFVLGAVLLAACGPEPGTPEYVLGKLEEGLVVGPKNLTLLTVDHVDAMLVSLGKPHVPSVGQVQIVERLVTLEVPDPAAIYGPLLDHSDPEVRRLVAKRLSWVATPAVAQLLIGRLEKEPSEIIRISIATAVQQLGLRLDPLDPKVARELMASLEKAPQNRKLDYVVALSGWPMNEAIAKVFEHVGSGNDARAEAASSGLLVLSKNHIEKVGPMIPAMLEHRLPPVRRNALRAVYYQLSGRRAQVKCSEAVVSALEKTIPNIRKDLRMFKESTNASKAEKQLVDEILGCMEESQKGNRPPSGKAGAGGLEIDRTGS